MNVLAMELGKRFERVYAYDFYRDVFPAGELAPYYAHPAEENIFHKYTAIVVEIDSSVSKKRPTVKRYTITDELDDLPSVGSTKNFCICAPISYAGKERKSENARFMYALCIEVDNLVVQGEEQSGLRDLLFQCDPGNKHRQFPRPTYLVASGNGLHLYYLFNKPVPLFPNVVKELSALKRELTKKIWNRYITMSWRDEDIQYESVFQAFRMVDTITKSGDEVEAFLVGDRVSIADLNEFVGAKSRLTEIYKSDLPLSIAKEKYPDWYERRVVQGQPKGSWTCNRAVYDWWLRRIGEEAVVGHRYYCLMMLAIYAIKCGLTLEELTDDCFGLLEVFDAKTIDDKNHFTEDDVITALQAFQDKALITYPINSISYRSGLHIEKNKRNYRKQAVHLKIARATLAIMNEEQGRPLQGRRDKQAIVLDWQRLNPNGKKSDCVRDTGLCRNTVVKWWDNHSGEV